MTPRQSSRGTGDAPALLYGSGAHPALDPSEACRICFAAFPAAATKVCPTAAVSRRLSQRREPAVVRRRADQHAEECTGSGPTSAPPMVEREQPQTPPPWRPPPITNCWRSHT